MEGLRPEATQSLVEVELFDHRKFDGASKLRRADIADDKLLGVKGSALLLAHLRA